MKPIIKIENVWKTYQMGKVEVNALRGLDLEIYPHDFVAIMGPSGSGKSTAMHMIGCLDVPTRGKVFLEGQDISELGESELASIRGKKIGFVFQTFNLLPTLDALENVTFPMVFQGIPVKERKQRALRILKLLGLSDRAHHRPAELSGGEQQRIAIARSLSNDPDIVLADEPTGNLDSKTSGEVMDVLIDLHNKEKKTLIIVTHDPHVAKYTKDEKLFNLQDGKVIRRRK